MLLQLASSAWGTGRPAAAAAASAGGPLAANPAAAAPVGVTNALLLRLHEATLDTGSRTAAGKTDPAVLQFHAPNTL